VTDSLAKRKIFSLEHRARLQQLKNQGRLVIAGPCPQIAEDSRGESGFSGSVIIADFATLSAAQNWAENDPFLKNGVYEAVAVKPFKQFLP